MRRLSPLFGLSLITLAVAPLLAFEDGLEERIRRVESGLLPAIVEQGEEGVGQDLLERMAAHRAPGLSLAVIEGGRIEWAKGYGVTEENGSPVTADTLFLAGSISKPVAATGALRLVQEGRLDLDADVNDRLTSWRIEHSEVMGEERVTLRRLLTHTAGLTVHGFPGYAAGKPVPTVQQVLDGEEPANTAPVRVDLEPGSEWRYSGGGYTVIQLLVSEVSKRSFAELLAASVLRPFGMHASTFENPLPASRHEEAASGHWATGKSVTGRWHTYPEMAAAGLWTTASDLARWAIGIQEAAAGSSEEVLSREMATQMLTPHLGNWGLGPGLSGEGQDLRFAHGGRDAGFDARVVAYALRGQGAAIMLNSNNDGDLIGEILGSIARAYNWPEFQDREQRTYIELPAGVLERYVGRFASAARSIRVSSSNGRLYAFVRGQRRLELFATGDDSFFFERPPGTVTFERNGDGDVVHLVLETGDERETATRVD